MSVLDIDLERIRWSEWREDPAPLYRRLRDDFPVFYDAPNDQFLVTRYEDVDAVSKDFRRFSSTPPDMVGGERISPMREEDPPRHTFLRRIVMPLFTPREMRRLEGYFAGVARGLLDRAEQGEVVEVSSQLAIPLPGRVTCDLLGVPLDQHERFLELTAERRALIAVSDKRVDDVGGLRPLEEIRDELWGIVGPVAQARRERPERDAISFLVQVQDEQGPEQMSDELIVDMLLHLLTAGFHTTQHLIELLIDLLADRRDLWDRLRADRSLVPVAIEEMLRFGSPVQSLQRRASEDVVLHGVTLPKNAWIALVYGSANRDERVFEDPDVFSLDRGVGRHVAFGAGIHYCPGAPVSRFEVRALFDEMLDRYVAIERAGPSERWPNDSRTVYTMRGFRSVPVRLRRSA